MSLGSIDCDKCVTVMRNVNSGEVVCGVGVGMGCMWELSVFLAQFCCEPKPAVENKVFKILKFKKWRHGD